MSKFELSLSYLEKMLKLRNVKYKILIFLIKNIIGRYQYYGKYEEVIKYYGILYPLLKNKKIKILLLQYASTSYYRIEQYNKCLDCLNEIEKLEPKTVGLKERKNNVQDIVLSKN